MKKLIIILVLMLGVLTSQAGIKVRHSKSHVVHKTANKIRYYKRHHQNHIFQRYLQTYHPHKGIFSTTFQPKGQRIF